MTLRQGVCTLWKNPAITEKQHKVLWMIAQVLAFGFMLGIISRAAWDHGIIAQIALALRDLGLAGWAMIQDVAAACSDLLKFVARYRIS